MIKTASPAGGARLRTRRMDLGFSVKRVSEILGVREATIYFWEAGQTEPAAELRPRLAALYQVPLYSTLYHGAQEVRVATPPDEVLDPTQTVTDAA